MKIEGPGKTNAPTKTEKTRKSGGVSGASFSEFLTESEAVDATTSSTPVSNVSLYVALQAAEAATDHENRRQALEWGGDLLAELEDLRLGLLMGDYTKNQLENLARRLRDKRVTVREPALVALLDEVELRAAVELAKYQQ
jgi:hypothetical protein